MHGDFRDIRLEWNEYVRIPIRGWKSTRSERNNVHVRLTNQHVKGLYAYLVAGRGYILIMIDAKICWQRHLIINVFLITLWAACLGKLPLLHQTVVCLGKKGINLYLLCKLYFKKYTIQGSLWFQFISFEKTYGLRRIEPFYSLAHACKHKSNIGNPASERI